MKNGIFTLDWGSVADAVVMAVVMAALTALVGAVGTTGFDVLSANWASIGHSMLNVSFITGVLTLGQEFLKTNTGSTLGITPPYQSQ